MKKQIVIDFDLVLCPSAEYWKDYLLTNYVQTVPFPEEGVLDYNLSNYFDTKDDDPKAFWKQSDLYDDMGIFPEAYHNIKKLYNLGWEVVFCSWCCPEHEASKIGLARKTFDFMSPDDFHFVSTHSKGVLRPDVAVDDRDEFLGMFGSGTFLIRYKTVYAQNKRARFDREAKDWNEIYSILEKEGFLEKE